MSKGNDKLGVLSKLHHLAGIMKIGNEERASRFKAFLS